MFVVPIPTPILVVTTSSHTRWAKLSKAELHKAVERAHKHVIFSDFVDFFLNVMGDDVNGWKFGEPENVLDDLESFGIFLKEQSDAYGPGIDLKEDQPLFTTECLGLGLGKEFSST